MKHSVADIMSFSMFGIPMVGADICGFNGDTTPDLCQRWSQLGAFYPFSRNHNEDEAKDQDPAVFSSDIVTSIVTAYRVRYSLLPYLYSLFYRATLYGETVARPLLFEYPGDHNTYSISTQFMWGPGLLISPVLEKDQTFTETYLPRGYWYGYYTLLRINSTGESYSIPAPKSTIPLFIRGGHVLPAQTPDVTTTLR
ncbi:lysosomal alpha-glucosidase [Diaphorina citri]|uniref:Lysosomal alpha-glucosidase n=1 Tax=Diaphorina citri TaxID=121845 RepID=A0A3Q0J763_DIACI|nr:lysosomal alpha-glucosidase [Diaphorina citri]